MGLGWKRYMTRDRVVEETKQALERVSRALAVHGGGVEFVDFDEESGRLTVRFSGACAACPYAAATVRGLVLETVRFCVPEVRETVLADIDGEL
jgi:Fe-S cluster biogenesis protein NfuA